MYVLDFSDICDHIVCHICMECFSVTNMICYECGPTYVVIRFTVHQQQVSLLYNTLVGLTGMVYPTTRIFLQSYIAEVSLKNFGNYLLQYPWLVLLSSIKVQSRIYDFFLRCLIINGFYFSVSELCINC